MFEREAVLGRDASSVFPTESAAAAGADAAATKASLGALRFITESEVPACGLSLIITRSLCKTETRQAPEVLVRTSLAAETRCSASPCAASVLSALYQVHIPGFGHTRERAGRAACSWRL